MGFLIPLNQINKNYQYFNLKFQDFVFKIVSLFLSISDKFIRLFGLYDFIVQAKIWRYFFH